MKKPTRKGLKAVFLKIAIGVVIGAALGLLYYTKVGCVTGTCPLTSTPVGSGLYGALLGGLVGSLFT